MDKLEKYLRDSWENYKRFPGTPEYLAYGDALYLYGKLKRGELQGTFIEALQRNSYKVHTSKTWSREFRSEAANWYQIIIIIVKEIEQ